MPDTTTRTPFAEAVETLGLTLTATFVPWSQSRHRDEKTPSLNWRVMLARADGVKPLVTDYMQGTGHIPGCRSVRRTIYQANYEHKVCESGKYSSQGADGIATTPLPVPDMADVLSCLVSDAGSVLNAHDFEEWATDLGYDPDSRTAERIYHACLEIARDLRTLLGSATLDHLLTLEH